MKIRLLGIRTACHPWIFLSTKTKIWIIYFPLSSNDARKYSFTPTHRHWHLFHSARYSQISLGKIDDTTIHLIDARNIALFIRSLDLDLEGYNVTFRKNFLEFLSHSIVSSDRQGSKKWTNRFDARFTFRGFTFGFVDRYLTMEWKLLVFCVHTYALAQRTVRERNTNPAKGIRTAETV